MRKKYNAHGDSYEASGATSLCMSREMERQSNRGFTVLLALLVGSLLLLLGLSMFTIVRKQVILSSIGRDSQLAFYAADTGAECALYWDFRHDAFAQAEGPVVTCDGEEIGSFSFLGYGEELVFEFEPNGLCSRVSVTKNEDAPRTRIEGRGYNTACADIANNPRALERAVGLNF